MSAQDGLRCLHLKSDSEKNQKNWVFLILNHIKMPSRKAHVITRITNANALAKIGYETIMIAPKRYRTAKSINELYGRLLLNCFYYPSLT